MTEVRPRSVRLMAKGSPSPRLSEKRLEGMTAGQTLEGEIPASEAVPEDSLPTRKIPRKEFPSSGPIEVGSAFEAHTATGGVVNLRIVAVDDHHVTARLLPPLVGTDSAIRN